MTKWLLSNVVFHKLPNSGCFVGKISAHTPTNYNLASVMASEVMTRRSMKFWNIRWKRQPNSKLFKLQA